MSMLRRINALIERVRPGPCVSMTAVFEDGHREQVPLDIATCTWAIQRAMQPEEPHILRFECDEDPEAAEDETQFFHCLTEDGDLSHVWDDFYIEERPSEEPEEFDGLGIS